MPGQETSVTMSGALNVAVSLLKTHKLILPFSSGRDEVEDINHVLLFCPFIWRIWSNIISWWGVYWAMPGSVSGLLQWWAGLKLKKKELPIWKAIQLAVFWSIWKQRNESIFKGSPVNFEGLCDSIKLIRDEIQAGKSDKEIYRKLEDDYGETVLYAPKFDLQTAALWLSPLLVAGAAGGIWAYKKHRQNTNVHIMALNLVRGVSLTPKEKQTMLDLLTPPPSERTNSSSRWRKWLPQ